MPPKSIGKNPTSVRFPVIGGEVCDTLVLARIVGPFGLSPIKIGEDIAKSTQEWSGLNLDVQLLIENRQATISVIPPASSLTACC